MDYSNKKIIGGIVVDKKSLEVHTKTGHLLGVLPKGEIPKDPKMILEMIEKKEKPKVFQPQPQKSGMSYGQVKSDRMGMPRKRGRPKKGE